MVHHVSSPPCIAATRDAHGSRSSKAGKWLAPLLVLICSVAVAHADGITLLSWKPYREMTVLSDATNPAGAKRDSVQWFVGRELARDILEIWRPELTAQVFEIADDYVKSVYPREDGYVVVLDVQQLFRALTTVIFGMITPRVAVATDELILMQPAPDPAVQTALSAAFLDYGFQVVDPETRLESLMREAQMQADAGDTQLVLGLPQELDCDIVVLGLSIAEEHSGRDGFNARVEYRVIEKATGRVICAVAKTNADYGGDSPIVAAKLALQRGAEDSILAMMSKLLNAYGKPVTKLRVFRLRSASEALRLRHDLQAALPSGSRVTLEQMHVKGAEATVYSVLTKADIADVAQALEELPGEHIRVTSIECRNLVSEAQ